MTVAAVVAGVEGVNGSTPHGIATPISLIAIAAAAFLIPLVAGRIRVPAIVLEIVFGILVGPVFGVIEAGEPLLDFLAEFGLFLLMFLAGFEIDFTRLERQGPAQLLTGLVLFGGFAVASYVGAGFLEHESIEQRLFLTFLMSAAALGLVVPALRDTRRSGTRTGQTILITAVFAEVLSLVGIVVLSVVVEKGVGLDLLSIPALLAAMLVVLIVLRRAAWWYPERFERLFRSDDPAEMGTRATLALLFVFVGLSTLLEIEAILGAFLAGAVFTFVFRDPGGLEEQLNGFAFGFFIPIFFINVGIAFPLDELEDPQILGQALALVAIAFVVKIVPSVLLVLRRFSGREAIAAGFILAGQLSVIIALADLGLDLGLLTTGLRAGAIMLVAVSAVVSPVMFRVLAPPIVEADRHHSLRSRLLGRG
ncbi:MAG TPA: cation:proton antiporter [Acidimicrobiia bacterium]|nr:cation:proton antiporter [Acidimicrobiia bacterium]